MRLDFEMRAGGSVDVGWMVYLGGYTLFHLIRLAMLGTFPS